MIHNRGTTLIPTAEPIITLFHPRAGGGGYGAFDEAGYALRKRSDMSNVYEGFLSCFI